MPNYFITKEKKKLIFIIFIGFGSILIFGALLLAHFLDFMPKSAFVDSNNIASIYYMNYDTSTLDNSEESKKIKYGYELFRNTPEYLGPDNGNQGLIFSGNRLACANCHLDNGTKPYSAPLIGIIQRFPQFRGRENKIGTIEERINGCMERSMNGKMMPEDSNEMLAFISYLNWISRYAPKDGKIEGTGFVKMKMINRAINIDHGKQIFTDHCVVCHQNDGQGVKSEDGKTYQYPPLWGNDSYNNGAGMTRVLTSAKFIKANMPFGTTYDSPTLSDEEAYDVAGYINQQKRPQKQNSEKDFPDLKKKPVSTPYPPYADNFSTEQHQKGPFKPIIDYYKQQFNITKTK
ncbi:c-type cytochrome [Lacinutrix iliipiscaria]|uniref:C-type cytochrome n=1 Tax=Lacinutrix iliipiscaria TaxID=1230532 RepID=A0ABW5WRT4_9FLAO